MKQKFKNLGFGIYVIVSFLAMLTISAKVVVSATKIIQDKAVWIIIGTLYIIISFLYFITLMLFTKMDWFDIKEVKQ